MFAVVTSRLLRYQLSSSVSMEMMTRTSDIWRPPAEVRGRIDDAQEAAPPACPEHDQLFCRARHSGPLALVRVGTPEKVEPAKAALDRPLNHQAHQDEADALMLPPRVAAALIEVHGLIRHEAVPRRRRLPIHVQRCEPEPMLSRHF